MSDIKNTKSVTNSGGLFDIDLKKMFYLSSFKVVSDFLPVAISNDYAEALPRNFLGKLFSEIANKRPLDLRSLKDDEREIAQNEYIKHVDDLNRSLYAINRFYTRYTISEDPKTIEEYVKYRIINKETMAELLNCTCCNPVLVTLREHQAGTSIDFPKFPLINEFIKSERFEDHTLQDVEYILNELSECSRLCGVLKDDENSYLKFGFKLYKHMHGNIKSVFKRDIVNHTAFKFAVDGYPYGTLSRRLYCVRNVEGVDNKFQLHDIYNNNIKAILTALSDMTFGRKTIKGVELPTEVYETKVLVNTFATCVLLIALYGEITLENVYNSKPILNSAYKNRGSIGFAATYERRNSFEQSRLPADKPWNIDEENRARSLSSSKVYKSTEIPGLHDISEVQKLAREGRIGIEMEDIDFNKEM